MRYLLWSIYLSCLPGVFAIEYLLEVFTRGICYGVFTRGIYIWSIIEGYLLEVFTRGIYYGVFT